MSNLMCDVIESSEVEIKSNEKRFLIQKQKKLFRCDYEGCCRQFREKGNLKTHLRIHTGEKPYICSKEGCNKSFITLGNLKSHQLNHSSGEKYLCEQCGKTYLSKEKYLIHEKIHFGQGAFICPYEGCAKSFNEKGNLKTHFRIHTGEKPYICKYPGCPQAFKALGHLKDHLKIHYNIKPYECQICNVKFARSSTLKIHNRTHTGEKPHQCNFQGCNKRFSEKGNMKTHFKTHLKKGENKLQIVDNPFKLTENKNEAMNVLLFGNNEDNLSTQMISPVSDYFPDSQIIQLINLRQNLNYTILNNDLIIKILYSHPLTNTLLTIKRKGEGFEGLESNSFNCDSSQINNPF